MASFFEPYPLSSENTVFEWDGDRLPYEIKYCLEVIGINSVTDLRKFDESQDIQQLFQGLCNQDDYPHFLEALEASRMYFTTPSPTRTKKTIHKQPMEEDPVLQDLQQQFTTVQLEYEALLSQKANYLQKIKAEYEKQSEMKASQTKIIERAKRLNKIAQHLMIDGKKYRLHHIRGDGNCMYNAVLTGARFHHLGQSFNTESVRMRLSQEILSHLDSHVDALVVQILLLIRDEEFHGIPQGEFFEMIQSAATQRKGIFNEAALDAVDDQICVILRDYGVSLYCQLIQSNGMWGGNVELGVLSSILGVQIIIHLPNESNAHSIINNTGNENAPKVHLQYSGSHYDVYIPQSERF
eukprot:gene16392-18594_t